MQNSIERSKTLKIAGKKFVKNLAGCDESVSEKRMLPRDGNPSESVAAFCRNGNLLGNKKGNKIKYKF